MTLETQKAIFEQLRGYLSEVGLESKFIAPLNALQLGETLMAKFSVADSSQKFALAEIGAANVDEDYDVVQIYTTWIMKVGNGKETLDKLLQHLNLQCHVGAFGLRPKDGGFALYHKHSVVFAEDEDSEIVLLQISYAISVIGSLIDGYFEFFEQVSEGKLSFEEVMASDIF